MIKIIHTYNHDADVSLTELKCYDKTSKFTAIKYLLFNIIQISTHFHQIKDGCLTFIIM